MSPRKYIQRKLPSSRLWRTVIGILLVIGGVFGFLPVLGFWMIPLGFIVLSIDLPWVRRKRRRFEVWWGKKRRERAKKKRAKKE